MMTLPRVPYALAMALPTPKENTTALVTGASSGIGADIARELARRGHGVTLVARREDRLKALADELAQAHDIRAEVIAADLTDADSRGDIPAELERRGLTPDILVNNAGFTTMGPVHRADRCHRARHGAHERGGGGRPVHPLRGRHGHSPPRRGAQHRVDRRAFQPLPGQAGYGASKAFVLSYGPALGAEVKGMGVTVTSLCPGPVETGFAEAAGLTDDEAGEALPKFMWVPPADVARAAVEGLDAGRPVVIPGAANRAAAALAHLAPKSLILPLMASRHPPLKQSPIS